MEGVLHISKVQALLGRESPDVVCLQEAPESFQADLAHRGYESTFAPMTIRTQQDKQFREGLITATRLPADCSIEYYHGSSTTIVPHDYQARLETVAHPLLAATMAHKSQPLRIVNIHMIVTPNGLSTDYQTVGMRRLLELLEPFPPHVLCGDFNMPRGFNELYETVTNRYVDAVPRRYTSSLDKSLHRLGNSPDLTEPLFESYMVDYIFTQPPYQAHDVRLEFGVSDHAAVIGEIAITQ